MTRRNGTNESVTSASGSTDDEDKNRSASHLSWGFRLFRSSFSCQHRFIWFPSVSSPSPYVTHVTRSAHHSCRRRVERTEGNRRWEERDKGRMIGEGSCHCVALASVPFPRPFRPFVVRSLTPSFVPHVGRSVPHFLRNDGTEEWRDGVKVERNRGRPFARYASLSLGRFVPPSHPRRRRVALTSLAPVSDGNGNNMRE